MIEQSDMSLISPAGDIKGINLYCRTSLNVIIGTCHFFV